MRILYDGQVYNLQVVGGVSRYFSNIIGRLPSDWMPVLLLNQPPDGSRPVHRNLRTYDIGNPVLGRFSNRLNAYYARLQNRRLRTITDRRRFDVAHPTYYTLCTGQQIDTLRCPIVITVWDMIHELYIEHDPEGVTAALKRKAIEAAQAIICISENTKADLQERYGLPENKITVTHLAADLDASVSYGPEPVPHQQYFLYVGVRYTYKNFDGLLRAFAKVHMSRPRVSLCLVGPALNSEELKTIADLGLGEVVENYGHVSDAHLAKLYRCSVAFVYPSFYEGFGIPPLEAMACGTAVVASNRSSIPEVVGDGGLLFDPFSRDDLTDKLLHLLDDEAERARLIEKGTRRVQMFSWDKTAVQTAEVYRAVSGQ